MYKNGFLRMYLPVIHPYSGQAATYSHSRDTGMYKGWVGCTWKDM